MNKDDYRKYVEILAKQPPLLIQITPLEIFLVVEMIVSCAKFRFVNIGIKMLASRLVGCLAARNSAIGADVRNNWLSKIKSN